ncbi:MAG: SpoIIE family protein phosphatase [Sphingobacteriaceae bacterium]|nr:SpoIIE family protein phosphatase [Sphingobacteriaceae bacterium]
MQLKITILQSSIIKAVLKEQIHYSYQKELGKLTWYGNSLSSKEITSNLEKANARMIALQQANEIETLNNKRKSTYLVILVVISFVIVLIVFLLVKQNKLKQSSNQKLETQNKIIFEKKHEIEQSIVYAKGIQTSFLPEKELLDIFLPRNFIFYEPKDIVSGDFYWFETSSNKEQILIACADSTGHGVPGALMSMVGINFLQQNVDRDKLDSPSTILKRLNNSVKNALKQNDIQSKQRDGMDVALALIDFTTNKLVFAGANRPLYIIRNHQLIELKATKHAIGGYTKNDQAFSDNEFQLEANDMLVLTTDGYADQFGGDDGKKLMTKKLKEYLVQISTLSCEDQFFQIKKAFTEWKGSYEQVDDVCLIG